MPISGKIFGAFIGFILLQIPGLLIGLLLGHLYDSGKFYNIFAHRATQPRNHRLFFNTTFSIMGYIAKADGQVSQREIQYAQNIMQHLNLNERMRAVAIEEFNNGKSPHFDYFSVCQSFKNNLGFKPSLIKNFLEVQVQLAYIDGPPSAQTHAALVNIFNALGFSSKVLHQFEAQFKAQYQYQRYRRHQQAHSQHHEQQHLNDAYTILGVSPSASNSEVKKAYRRAMSKHHPDRLIAQGVPPEMIKLATEKTQQIKAAYETIKDKRNL